VEIKIYNVIGTEVRTLLAQQKNAGTYEIIFDADNLSSGIYYYTIRYQNLQLTRKMILIK
jgi:hypothetical protein